MSILADAKALVAKIESEFSPQIKIAENDAKAIGAATLSFIETNGLKDLYTIAMTVLTNVASSTPWVTVLATVVSQGEAAGIAIAKGAESVVVSQAQADLIATGTIPAPVATPAV